MIHFIVDNSKTLLAGKLVYRMSEYSFDFETSSIIEMNRRIGRNGTTSILIGSIQIEISVTTGIILFVWGYHPQQGWKHASLSPPSICGGIVQVLLDNPLQEGISIPYKQINEWPTFYDPTNGWVCIGQHNYDQSSECVEFSTKTVAVINGRVLQALWLHPNFE